MNQRLLSALLFLGAPFAVQSIASPVSTAPASEHSLEVMPVPIKVVSPTAIPRAYEDTTVELRLLIDQNGVPSEIEPVGMLPVQVSERLRTALRQWRFSPRYVGGQPVATRVQLPLHLIAGPLKD